MDLSKEYNPAPKIIHKRAKPKQRNVTKITQKVREEVLRRSGGNCERCGKNRNASMGMEMSHLDQAGQYGSGSDPSNVVLLCGPSVNTGTCHNFADYTKEGREWRKAKREELQNYYGGRT